MILEELVQLVEAAMLDQCVNHQLVQIMLRNNKNISQINKQGKLRALVMFYIPVQAVRV